MTPQRALNLIAVGFTALSMYLTAQATSVYIPGYIPVVVGGVAVVASAINAAWTSLPAMTKQLVKSQGLILAHREVDKAADVLPSEPPVI